MVLRVGQLFCDDSTIIALVINSVSMGYVWVGGVIKNSPNLLDVIYGQPLRGICCLLSQNGLTFLEQLTF